MIEEAQELFQRGDFARAYDLYQKMLADEPENHEVLFMMSLCRQRQENLAEASELLNQALLYHPTQALYHYSLGSLRVRLGQMRGAMESYAQAVRLNPNYADAHVGVGYVHLAQGQHREAEGALRAAIRANPRVTAAHAHLGVTLLAQERVEEALQALKEAAELRPDDVYTQTHLGRAFHKAGHYAFAVQCFRNALARFPDQSPLWLWLGQSLAETHQDQEAAEALRKSMELGGENADALYSLARIYLRHGEPQGALNMLLRVLHLRPDDLDVRLSAARACRQLQRYEEAQDILNDHADETPVRKLLARLALDRQQWEVARTHLATLKLAGVQDVETQLLQAEAAVLQGEWPQAADLLAPLLTLPEPPPTALLLEAQRLFNLGDAGEAKRLLEQIDSAAQPGLADEVRDWRVRVLHATGDTRAAWKLARENTTRHASIMPALAEEPPEGVINDATESALNQDVVWSWPPRGPEDEQPDPILIYGWPGSGRESLLMALAGTMGVQVLRDHVLAQRGRREALCWPRGATALSQLSEADLRLRRKRYWREVRRMLPRWETLPLVDGLWFSAAALPTIYRLFPTARVVVMQRDETAMSLDWALGGYVDVAAMHARWGEEQRLLRQAMSVLPLQWITIDHAAVRAQGADTLQALTQHLPGVDAADLAQRMLRIAARLEMPAVASAEDDAALVELFVT